MKPVRRRSAGNVPDGEPEALLHGHEEAGTQETSKDDSTPHESLFGPLLRHRHVEAVRDRHLHHDLPQHGRHGCGTLRPTARLYLHFGVVQRPFHHHVRPGYGRYHLCLLNVFILL